MTADQKKLAACSCFWVAYFLFFFAFFSGYAPIPEYSHSAPIGSAIRHSFSIFGYCVIGAWFHAATGKNDDHSSYSSRFRTGIFVGAFASIMLLYAVLSKHFS